MISHTLARVLYAAETPRCYVFEMRRNCSNLRIQPNSLETIPPPEPVENSRRPVTHSQTGTAIRPPDR